MTYNMNKRQCDILEKLKYIRELSIESLMQEFGVSERTLRNDIQDLNEILGNQAVLNISAEKIVITARKNLPDVIEKIMDQSDYYQYKLSAEERKAIEALIVLYSDSYITTSLIANRLSVSKSTIVSEIKYLKDLFSRFDLQLKPKTKFGFVVIGTELNIRQLIFSLIPNSGNRDEFSSSYCSLIENEASGQVDRDAVRQAIIEWEQQYNLELTDGSFKDIENYLTVVTNRIIIGHSLDGTVLQGTPYFRDAAQALLVHTMNCLKIVSSFGQAEVLELSNRLAGCAFIKNMDSDSSTNSVYLQMQASAFVNNVCNDLNIDQQISYDKYRSLLTHIESYEQLRRSGRKAIKNPMREELEENYPNVFRAVNENIGMLEKLFSSPIDQDEKSYIVMYLIVMLEEVLGPAKPIGAVLVCSSGMCTALLLQAKLIQNFNIEIKAILSLHKFANYDLSNVDMVISTVWIENVGKPFACINPMLNEKDVDIIRNLIQCEDVSMNRQEHSRRAINARILAYMQEYLSIVEDPKFKSDQSRSNQLIAFNEKYFDAADHLNKECYLYELLREETIMLDYGVDNWEDAIRVSGQQLLQKGDIEQRYIDRMVEVVVENGPYIVFVPGVAIAHASQSDGSNRLGISLVRLANPVNFHHETNDPVKIVACISVGKGRQYLLPFFHLIKIVQNKEIMDFLLKTNNKGQMIDIIRFYELYKKEKLE